ncbi:MAG TPA: glycosyltransferase family 2 protein [Bacteroidales bacterium]|nr:glycosyltransferase family 2 protein [Bacteroidales bacterium]HPS63231.1 glycosyltransferase family 2 protein [Bacteroidales bacterium]
MPKVSIITPLYNGTAYVADAIRSVVGQTFTDWEMIIADDGSTDHPEPVVASAAGGDPRIRLILLARNSGAASARNAALELATGDFIAFLDSDDTWKPEKLEQQIGFMERNRWAFSFTSYEVMEATGRPAEKIIRAPQRMDYNHYLRNTAIGCLTVMIDRRLTGPFRMPLLRSSHDMALWLELMKRGFDAFGIDEILASYRLVGTSNTANKWKAARDVWKVYRDVERLSLARSITSFAGYAFHAAAKRL